MIAKASVDAVEEQYMVRCPNCNTGEVVRRHRHGVADELRAWFGRWPYYCRDCKTFFYAPQRHAENPGNMGDAARNSGHRGGESERSRFACTIDSVRPTAKIVVEAESHAQMNEILLALSRAVAGYDRARYRAPQLVAGKPGREA